MHSFPELPSQPLLGACSVCKPLLLAIDTELWPHDGAADEWHQPRSMGDRPRRSPVQLTGSQLSRSDGVDEANFQHLVGWHAKGFVRRLTPARMHRYHELSISQEAQQCMVCLCKHAGRHHIL